MNATEPLWEDLVIREAPPAPAAPAPSAPAPAASPARPALKPHQHQIQAAYLAHELRAPVTAIRLGLEGLSEQVAPRLEPDERQLLEIAIRNTNRLEGLVNDIMDYSKIAAGKMAIVKEACDARALIDEAVEAMRAAATARGVKIVKDVAPGLPRCSAEGRRVVQVLINLLSNAIKHSPARGTVVVAAALGRHAHEGTVLFRVKDSGPGLAPADLERVFGLFEQAGGALKKTEGTGLGLPLARAMVELHGGRIWAESWKGAGAAFCFTIPAAARDLARPVDVYPEPIQVSGLLAEFGRRCNAVLALFI